MKAVVLGGAGVLGSSLTELLLGKGYDVKVIDIIRREEAWRLTEYMDMITYDWKSTLDLRKDDIDVADIVIDCSVGVPDRPFGIDSATHTMMGNLMPPLRLLEVVRRLKRKPLLIYPSSLNSLYGHGKKTYTEKDLPNPNSVYGWTKGCAEQLYMAYHKTYDIPVVITRVGSAFGPKMRSDELVARLILYCLKGRDFHLRSPFAKRLWCYSKDVLSFYDKLISRVDDPSIVGKILHCTGNRDDAIITNSELAWMIRRITKSEIEIIDETYEPGEKGIDFTVDYTFTKNLLGWEPKFSLSEGLEETVEWFRENEWRYL